MLKKITVFAGSRAGNAPIYNEKAAELGKYLAKNGYEILYGAGGTGLMGALADATLAAGGLIHGKLLAAYSDAHPGITSLEISDTPYEWQESMRASDGLIVLPGGFGILGEGMYSLAAAQAGMYSKPIAFFNINGYFNKLSGFMTHIAEQGFMRPQDEKLFIVSDDIEEMIAEMKAYRPA